MEYRKINVEKCIAIAKGIADEVQNTQVMGFDYVFDQPDIFVHEEIMTDIAPLGAWTLNTPRDDTTYLYKHYIILDGVKFYAITADTINV